MYGHPFTRRFVLERVSQPDIEPLTVAELKLHLGGFDSNTDENDMLTSLIKGARQWAEHRTGRALIDQQWRLTFGQGVAVNWVTDAVTGPYFGVVTWQPDEILLRRSPALEIVSFKSVDDGGNETDVDASTYELRYADSKYPRIVGLNGATWVTGLYRVVFRAGFADRSASPQEDASVVPDCFKSAMKLHAEAIYDRDKDVIETYLQVAADLIAHEDCNAGFA